MIGEAGDAEAGEHIEAKVQPCNEGLREEATIPALGDGEVGNNPAGGGVESGAESVGEVGDLLRGEAIEKKVGDDEIVVRGARVPLAGVRIVSAHADGMRAGILDKGLEHGTAGIDGIDRDGRILLEEAGEEASIAVPEEERVADRLQLIGIGAAAAAQRSAEGETFHPAIGAGEAIEIGCALHGEERQRCEQDEIGGGARDGVIPSRSIEKCQQT